FALAPFDELDRMPFRILHHETQAVVGPSFNLANLYSLFGEIPPQANDVVGGKGDVIHTVGRLRVRRSAVADPLSANHVARDAAGLDRRGGSKAEQIAVKLSDAVRRGGVERDVVDAEDARPAGRSLGIGADLEDYEKEGKDKLFHGASILVQLAAVGLRRCRLEISSILATWTARSGDSKRFRR